MSTEHNPEPRQWDFPYPFVAHITPDAGKAEAHEICGNLHCPAAHVTHYQGEHPSCAAKLSETPAQQPAQEPCLTCEGHGIIGGYEGSGNDMSPVGYPCPDCNPPAQQPAEAMLETEDSELSRLREENKKLHKQNAHMMRRVYSNEDTELDCPFCESYPATGSPQEVPMCPLCQVESSLGDLRAQLSTGRAARESEMRVLREDNDAHVQRCYAAERERDSLAGRLAESESREHQAREALEKAKKQVGHAFWICEHLAAEESINTPREWQAQAGAFASTMEEIERSISAPTSTTIADLRLRLETAERERDAVVKDRERLEERIRSAVDDDIVSAYIAGASIRDIAKRSKLSKDSIRIMLRIAGTEIRPPGFQPNWRKTRAALATNQETK